MINKPKSYKQIKWFLRMVCGICISISVVALGSWLLLADCNLVDSSASIVKFTGEEEVVPFSAQYGLQWVPDGNLSFLKFDDDIHLWLAGTGGSAYYFYGPNFDSLAPSKVDGNGMASPVFEPSNSGFDEGYAAPGSVIRVPDSSDMLMFYHAEDHTCDPINRQKIRVGIGLARSTDNGATWTRLGQIISGRDVASRCPEKFNGAGYPSVVFSPDGKYYYLYYMDWWNTEDLGPDAIHLARALVSNDGTPGSWVKYYEGAFSEPGLGGNSTPVINRAGSDAAFAGNPNISFNTFLGQYIAIVTGHDGFSYSLSGNGVNWSVPVLFFRFPTRTDELQTGDVWYSYASLLSTSQEAHNITGHTAYLYYSRGLKDQEPHYMVRRPLKIGLEVYLPVIVKNFSNALLSCPPLQIKETRQIAPNSFIVGDIVIDGNIQYDLGGEKEGTVAFFEQSAIVFAEWGAACYSGNSNFVDQIMQHEFDGGCGSETGCDKVRRVTVKINGQQEVKCYYPDGSIQDLQMEGNNTLCP